MGRMKNNSSGFTLITTLMLLFLLSGMAIGMLMMVNTEVKVGTQDVQNNVTFHASEGAIEKMTADIANLFTNTLSPNPNDITTLATVPGPPTLPGITFPAGGYTLEPVTNPPNCNGTPPGCVMVENPGVVQSGPYAGLNAELLQVNLQATAQGLLGDEVQMSRTVEVAMIPVFQFGAFADGDIAFFTNPTLTFNGRIHTNGDLYLGCGGGYNCTFTNKLSAYGNVIRANIPNGVGAAAANDQGSVLVPGATNGCSGAQPACTTLPVNGDLWGSVTGAGGSPPASAYNAGPPDWVTKISEGTWTAANKYLGGMLIDGNYGNAPNSGATNLSLPFVSGATLAATPGLGNPPGPQNYEIVRRAPAGELATSPLGASRLYNEAAIRVLLSDTPDELPGGRADPDNIRLANVKNPWAAGGVDYRFGVATNQTANLAPLAGGASYMTYFATASAMVPNPGAAQAAGVYYPDWLYAPQPTPAALAGEFIDANLPFMFSNNWSATKAPQTVTSANSCSTTTGVCTYPYYPTPVLSTATPPASTNANDTQWNLIDGYLRVEFLPQSGACPGPGAQVNGYCAITREWLGLGFARDWYTPIAPGAGPRGYVAGSSNDVNPYAILILQQPAKRNTVTWPPVAPNTTAPTTAGTAPTCNKVGASYTCNGGTPPEVAYDTAAAIPGNLPWYGNSSVAVPSITAFNWYPINFYDAREGEPNDIIQGNNSCTAQGVMNAVELDVGNLNQWLQGNIPGSGALVNYTNQNGYVLYFSDRRGMLPNPNGTQTVAKGNISGDAGFEDVVNSGSANRAPDGALEAAPFGRKLSPEDANLNGVLDKFGPQNLGLGLAYVPLPVGVAGNPYTVAAGAYTAGNAVNTEIMGGANPNPYLAGTANGRMLYCAVAKNAWISGARHVLKLVDGSLGNLPTVPGGVFPASSGGFTVGSENPVYVVGNYNSNCAAAGNAGCTAGNLNYDPNWPTPPAAADVKHAAASIVADTVTMLSNGWADWNSMLLQPTQPCPNGTGSGTSCAGLAGNRAAATSYYRMAIATGNVQAFPLPGWANGNEPFIGTDGGMGNFLRMLEAWGEGSATEQTLNYNGSMVNLFFSTYNTGIFKCCDYSVYTPPKRNYNFDTNFTIFSELPPGTPMFRDIDNLNYRQSFTACTVGANGLCTN